MKTFTLVRDLGSNALDFGLERKKTVLAIVGGITLIAVAGVIVSRILRARASARTERAEGGNDVDLGETAQALKTNAGKAASNLAAKA